MTTFEKLTFALVWYWGDLVISCPPNVNAGDNVWDMTITFGVIFATTAVILLRFAPKEDEPRSHITTNQQVCRCCGK